MLVPGSANATLLSAGYSLNLIVAADTLNYNMRSAAIAAGWDGITPINLTCTVNAGVVIRASSTSSYAVDTHSSWPTGSTITLINNGTISGRGGAGGSIWGTHAGGSGGPAFRNQFAGLKIINNGVIQGGGGAGGIGGGRHGSSSDAWHYALPAGGGGDAIILTANTIIDNVGVIGGGGGGGGGANPSPVYGGWDQSAGSGGGGRPEGAGATPADGGQGWVPWGNSASLTSPGSGGAGNAGQPSGGSGGNLGAAGGLGGGAAGRCLVSSGFSVAWIATGTRLGSIS